MNEHQLSSLELRTQNEKRESAMESAMREVIEERIRQEKKWGEQNHSPADWMMILMEEVGEFAKAVLNREGDNIKTELIQFTAVALSMLECCNRNNWHKALDNGVGQ